MKKLLSIVVVLTALLSSCRERDRYIQINGYAQGGTYTVKLNMRGVEASPEEIRDSVEAILTKVDTTLSGYNKGSLLSKFNAGGTIRPNDLFLEMYRVSYLWWKRSGGALDFAAGPLYDAWGFGFKEGTMPTDEKVREIVGRCGMKLLKPEMPLRPDGTLSQEDLLLEPGSADRIVLNYNAIAQGYTSDLVAAYLYRIGVTDMLVDIGEIWCDGLNPTGGPWTVGVDKPVEGSQETSWEQLSGVWMGDGTPRGVVTSGNYRKFYVKDGRKYAHTIDPRAGYPVQHNLLSATVVSSVSAADADALATWCMVVGLDEAKAILEADPALEGLLVSEAPDGSMAVWESSGFTGRQ